MCSHKHFAHIFKELENCLSPRPNPKAQVEKPCLKYSKCLFTSTSSNVPKGNSPYILIPGLGRFVQAPPLSFRDKNRQRPRRPSFIPPSSPLPPPLSRLSRKLSPHEEGVPHNTSSAFPRDPTQNK